MSLISLTFFAFAAIVIILYYIVPKKMQWVVLLFASLFFMGYASKFTILYMIATTVLIYVSAIWIQKLNDRFNAAKKELSKTERKVLKANIKKKQKLILSFAVVVIIGVLAVLKYSNFFSDIINDITELIVSRSVIPIIKLSVPLGISYYTLMSVSYIVDVYRGTINAEKNPFRLLLFVCYFPHITEGPFDTYDKLAPQLRAYHKFNYDAFMNAACLLLLGLIKKFVLADRLAYVSNELFDNYTEYTGIPVLVGMFAYAIQIYFDFSGCIDVFRGLSRMFGIDIAKNFDRPFFSHSVQEFWRRWHITLGAWLKNYIFYPVSLSSVSKRISKSVNKKIKIKSLSATIITALPLFCVWITMGIWHGASWKYIVYGLYYFVLIILGTLFEPLFAKIFKITKINRDGKAFGLFQIIRTDCLVLIGLTMFRADTIGQFIHMLKSLAVLNVAGIEHLALNSGDLTFEDFLFTAVLIIAFFVAELLSEKGFDIKSRTINNDSRRWIFITIMILAVILLGIYGTGYTEQVSVYAEF